ncbi:hypothetical protein ZWY2020_011324 [Hordeum vulgare]|nr:hypothetical protein ZWY2020_011324 [Hordeum vulgare]
MTALGTGGLKSSVSGFGSDQFDESDDGERKKMMRFFNWFYFFVSIGALLAVTVLVYVQDNIGRRWGYGICAVAAVTTAAWSKRALPLPSDPSMLYDVDDAAAAGEDLKGKQKLPHSKECRFLDHAAIIDRAEAASPAEASKWTLCTRTDVEEMTTFAVEQASSWTAASEARIPHPGGLLTVFLIGSILLTVPLYDRLIAPVARRITGNPHGLSRSSASSSASSCPSSAWLPRRSSSDTASRRPPRDHPHGVPAHAAVLARRSRRGVHVHGPARLLPARVPKGDEDHEHGLFLSTCALGFFFSTVTVTIVHKVTGTGRGQRRMARRQPRPGRLDYFYWLLAVMSAINIVFSRWRQAMFTRRSAWLMPALSSPMRRP